MKERPSRESGASALLIAGSMLLLLGFAALAIDGGLVYNERNQQQAAVDTATLSAGISTTVGTTQPGCLSSGTIERTSACNGASVAISIVNENLGTGYTAADFSDTTRCSDAAFPAEYAAAGSNPGIVPEINGTDTLCIRYNENLSKIRIILPTFEVDTTFGAVVGRNEIPVSAVAEAEVELGLQGSIIPFAIGPTAASASYACIFTPGFGGSNNPLDACSGAADGNFGYLMSYLYGDDQLNTPIACGSSGGLNDSTRIAATMAKGADHLFGTDLMIPGIAADQAECPNKNQFIDHVDVRTGGFASSVEVGLFTDDIMGTEGRLLCKDGTGLEPDWLDPALDSQNAAGSQSDCVQVNSSYSQFLDNTPLWDFIDNSVTELADSNACNAVKNRADMESCLKSWRQWPGPDGVAGSGDEVHTESLFTKDIAESPRFGWVPLLNTDPATGGSGLYPILDFVPLYLQTIYLKCTAADSCEVVHEPGPNTAPACTGTLAACGYPSTGKKALDALSSFILTRDMLPEPISNFPTRTDRREYNLSE